MGIRERQLGSKRPGVYRVGMAGYRLGGMYLQSDPGGVPPNRFQHLENVSFFGGELGERGGQQKLNEDPLHDAAACIKSIEDFQTEPFRMYAVYDGCPGISTSVGKSILWIDPDQEPEVQRGVYYQDAANAVVLGTFNEQLHVGLDTKLQRFVIVVAPWGQESLGIGGSKQDIPLADYTPLIVSVLLTFDGKLFVGLDGGVGASAVGVWDGVTSYAQASGPAAVDLGAIDPVTAFGVWRDKLIAGHAAASNRIRLRSVGAVPGTWTSVVPGAGTIAAVKILSYKDIVYITDGADNVWSYDGTTLAVARTVAGAFMRGLEVFNGYLYYGYETAANHAVIGRFDGTTWDDTHKDLTAQFAIARLPRALCEYRGALWAGVNSSVGNGAHLYRSPQTDTAGVWEDKYGTGGAVGDVNDLVVF